MKKFKSLFLGLFIFQMSMLSYSQSFDFDMFSAGIEDGMKIFVPYVTPWVDAFGTDLNGGWYNTAKPHQFGGFDLTFTTSVTIIPEGHHLYDLGEIDFQNLTVVGESTLAPTIAGNTAPGPMLRYETNGVTITEFESPQGTGFSYFPAPMIQAGIGLPLGTEVVVRFLPVIKIPNTRSDFSLWGVGMKHSIAQYIPGVKKAPLDISVFGGYTRISSEVGISAQPVTYDYLTSYTPEDFNNQAIKTITEGYNVSLIASTAFPVINVYGSIGYSKSRTKSRIDANIPVPAYDPLLNPDGPVVRDEDVTRIPDIEIQNISGLRTTIGAKLNIGGLTLHVDYTYADYSILTCGLGASFR